MGGCSERQILRRDKQMPPLVEDDHFVSMRIDAPPHDPQPRAVEVRVRPQAGEGGGGVGKEFDVVRAHG